MIGKNAVRLFHDDHAVFGKNLLTQIFRSHDPNQTCYLSELIQNILEKTIVI